VSPDEDSPDSTPPARALRSRQTGQNSAAPESSLPQLGQVRWVFVLIVLTAFKFAIDASEKSSSVTGSSQPQITIQNLVPLQVRLAPSNEQRRIVSKLEKLLDKVDSCRKRLAKIPILFKRFRQAVLDAACSGYLTADWREYNEFAGEPNEIVAAPEEFPTLPKTWRWSPLLSVCDNIVNCPHSTPKWTDTGHICARTTNFKPGYLDLSEIRYVSGRTFEERIERLKPKPGDILYSREGGILGVACIIPKGVNLCLGQRMMLFRVNGDLKNELLMHWLNGSPILRHVGKLTGGSAYVDSLKQSILAKAFRGELVPQDPNDEPATLLIERIREARATRDTTPVCLPNAILGGL
jgi:type I restriction enzyme S subunit